MNPMDLAYTRTTTKSVDEAVQAVQDAAMKRMFRTLHVHDVDRTLAEKGFTIPRYCIVEVCNASFAHQVITRYMPVGMMLPCPIAVYDDGGVTTMVLMKPSAIGAMMPEQDFGSIPEDVERILISAVNEAAE
jgi:uncharacterized protein (DUF302 family)